MDDGGRLAGSATDAPVLARREASVVTLTLNRPGQRNALDPELAGALAAAVEAASADLDVRVIDFDVPPVAVNRAVRDEVVQMCVVLECPGVRDVGRVVHQPPEEPECVSSAQFCWADRVGKLHLEGGGVTRSRWRFRCWRVHLVAQEDDALHSR